MKIILKLTETEKQEKIDLLLEVFANLCVVSKEAQKQKSYFLELVNSRKFLEASLLFKKMQKTNDY